MKRVLIIDDEYLIGQLINSLIHYQELDLVNVGVFSNSEQALETILTDAPDIVITDMRMPGIDGLEMIRKSREAGQNIKFIVVSGYREFEYAYQALNFGVEDYILKPVKERELNRTLAKVMEKIETENKTREIFFHYDKSREILRSDLMNRIIEDEITEMPDGAILQFRGSYYLGIDLKLDCIEYPGRHEKEMDLLIENVRGIMEESVSLGVSEFLLCCKDAMHVYCMINYSEEQKVFLDKLLSDLLARVKDYLLGFDRYRATMGIGTEQTSFFRIQKSIQEAYRAVCNRIRFGTGRLIYFEELTGSHGEEFLKAVENMSADMKKAIDVCSVEEINACVDSVMHLQRSMSEYDFFYVYKAAIQMVEVFYQYCKELNLAVDKQKYEILEAIMHCTGMRQLVNLLKNSFSVCINRILLQKENESSLPIRVAQGYIADHLGEKIQLETIAEVVNLNPVYFSALFKKETGTNFATYLANERMEKAKKMLVDTNDTIEAIGCLVGYGNYKYFCQQFKKLVGVKPNVYRRLHM